MKSIVRQTYFYLRLCNKNWRPLWRIDHSCHASRPLSQSCHVPTESVDECHLLSGDKFIDASDPETRKDMEEHFRVYENFITEEEEKSLFDEVEPYLKRLRYETSHWDDVCIYLITFHHRIFTLYAGRYISATIWTIIMWKDFHIGTILFYFCKLHITFHRAFTNPVTLFSIHCLSDSYNGKILRLGDLNGMYIVW